MNKTYIFAGVGAGIAVIALVVALSSPIVITMSLDQILANRDCTALDEWGNENLFREGLDLTQEQRSGIMNLAFECEFKALENMFGS